MKFFTLLLLISSGFAVNAFAKNCDDRNQYKKELGIYNVSHYTCTDADYAANKKQREEFDQHLADQGKVNSGEYRQKTDQNGKPMFNEAGQPVLEKVASNNAAPSCGRTVDGATGKVTYRSCDTTQIVNAGVDGADVVQTVTNSLIQNKRGTKEIKKLSEQTVTAAASYQSQSDLAKSAANLNLQQAMTQGAAATTQGVFSALHAVEAKKVKSKLQQEIAIAQDPNAPMDQRMKAEASIPQLEAELRAQNDMAVKQGLVAAQTAQKAMTTVNNANQLKSNAATLQAQANAAGETGSGYYYTPPTTGTMDEGVSAVSPLDGSVVAPLDQSTTDLAGGTDDFNPNLGQNDTMGPMPGAFKEGAAGGGAPGGSSSLGGSGGTSASRGDGSEGKQEAGPGKPQTGGQYASGDGGSPKFSRGSGSPSVGVDSSFADLLKKMLPGNDEGTKHSSLDLAEDRSPASDQATVMGRNKNIFMEISKRYQKKHHEGAVTFQ